jgi:hypothetical protein
LFLQNIIIYYDLLYLVLPFFVVDFLSSLYLLLSVLIFYLISFLSYTSFSKQKYIFSFI